MQRNNLVVLHGHVASFFPLPVRDLHEESVHQRLPDVSIQLLRIVDGDAVNLESFHGPLQLGADIISLQEGTRVQIVVPGPILVPTVWRKRSYQHLVHE